MRDRGFVASFTCTGRRPYPSSSRLLAEGVSDRMMQGEARYGGIEVQQGWGTLRRP